MTPSMKNRFYRLAMAAFLAATVLLYGFVESARSAPLPMAYNVYLLRDTNGGSDPILRIMTPVGITGCPKISELVPTVKVNDIYLDVKITGYGIDKNNLPREPHIACNKAMQFAIADIPLPRANLYDSGIKALRLGFISGGIGRDQYDVALDGPKLSLTAKSPAVFKSGKRPDGSIATEFWFYPENTLILSAPTTQKDQQSAAIEAFASKNGLTPLAQLLDGFSAPSGQTIRQYYVDQSGKVFAQLPLEGDVTLEGDVMGRHPGAHE